MKLTTMQQRIILLVILCAMLFGVYVWQKQQPEGRGWGSNFYLWSPVIAPEEETFEDATGLSWTQGGSETPAPSEEYGEALNRYGDRRFQFVNCNGTPGRQVVALGSVVMLDNRDNETRTIAIGSKSYRIAPYGFVLFTANEVGDLAVTCDGGGAATLTVER